MKVGDTVVADRDIVEPGFDGPGVYVHARRGDRGTLLARAEAGRGWWVILWKNSVYDSPEGHVSLSD